VSGRAGKGAWTSPSPRARRELLLAFERAVVLAVLVGWRGVELGILEYYDGGAVENAMVEATSRSVMGLLKYICKYISQVGKKMSAENGGRSLPALRAGERVAGTMVGFNHLVSNSSFRDPNRLPPQQTKKNTHSNGRTHLHRPPRGPSLHRQGQSPRYLRACR